MAFTTILISVGLILRLKIILHFWVSMQIKTVINKILFLRFVYEQYCLKLFGPFVWAEAVLTCFHKRTSLETPAEKQYKWFQFFESDRSHRRNR